MSVSAIKVTLGASLGEGQYASKASFVADPLAAATTADTAVGVVVTDNTTTLADIDAFAAAIIAITGDTYVAHQFIFGGATGLTHAQVATTFALLNTAITDFLAAQAAAVAAKANTVTAKAAVGGNLLMMVDTAVLTTSNAVKWAAKQALNAAKNIGIVTP